MYDYAYVSAHVLCGDVCAKVHTCAQPQAAAHLRGSRERWPCRGVHGREGHPHKQLYGTPALTRVTRTVSRQLRP